MASDAELRRLLDERAIHRRLVDFCRGIDRGDAALVTSVYHPDGTDDHGRFKGLGVDFAAYAIPRLQARYSATAHSITNTWIELVDDDTAYVESHVCARHLREDEDGPLLEVFGGRYVDRFERRDSEWKIADRVVVHDWDTVERLETAFPPDRFARGARGPDDPSYRRR